MPQCSSGKYHGVQCCAVQYNKAVRRHAGTAPATWPIGPGEISILVCTALQCTAPQCTTLHWTIPQFTALHCTELLNSALHCNAMHCTTLHYTTLCCSAHHMCAVQCTKECISADNGPSVSDYLSPLSAASQAPPVHQGETGGSTKGDRILPNYELGVRILPNYELGGCRELSIRGINWNQNLGP